MRDRPNSLVPVWIVGLLLVCPAAPELLGQADRLPELGQAFVHRHCVACHGGSAPTAGLALDALRSSPVGEHAPAWEQVVRKLKGRQMPPLGAQRPDEDAYREVVELLESLLDEAAAHAPDPGRTATFRRLTRTEYRNAVRDLLGLDIDLSALLPRDESSSGFDNITVGDLSPTLLEAYVEAADTVSRLALGRPVSTPVVETVKQKPDLTQEWHVDGLPVGTRGGAAFSHFFPLDAEYEIVIRLTRDRDEQVEGLRAPHQVELLLDRERVRLFEVVPPRHIGDHTMVDKHLRVRIPVSAGPHTVAVTFLKQPWAVLETDRQPYQAHFNVYRHPRIQPAVYEVSIMGPFQATGPGRTPSRERILTCVPVDVDDEDRCAREILSTLLRRAYRRPLTDRDLESGLESFRLGRAEGGFEAGVEMAVAAILVSPDFLFRIERDPPGVDPGAPYRVSGAELASRLSFFLWSSIPDDQLLNAALRGDLGHREGLDRQVGRMLRDPRSRSLLTNFAAQWLHLRNLESATPDKRLFPDFDDNLRQAMRRETEMLLETVIREDRSVLELLSANYTFVNERLAKHYRLPHVYGTWFRKVDLDEGSQRGGLLRHGSILTVTSYSTRTSPVLRGHWVLENLLGVPPPPPPADVPALEEQTVDSSLSLRERLTQHRANPACAGCHSMMDPIGFAMENYDAVGRWRTAENELPIDSTAGFPGGAEFQGVGGLEAELLARPELFVGTLAEKMLTYALGRVIRPSDGPAVRKIVRESAAQGYRFSSLVRGIAHSEPFQMRRSR